nr:hypothetical protein [Tanacetum cinerariifolium]
MKIIPDKEEVAIEAIPLAVKSPNIVDWKIHKERKKSYYQIIRADRTSKMYMVFNRILKEFNREELEDLYNLVKAKYGSTRQVEDLDLLLWGDLKTMFEPHVENQIEEEVYVCQPPGFEDLEFSDRVYKVEKALYELHQAPRAWYKTLSTYVLDNGFQKGKIDKTLFIKRHKGDILLDEDGEEVDVHMYRSMSGSLMYLTSSRLDIVFTVCACARYQVNPKVSHLYAVKMIFWYLKGQPKLGLWYPNDYPFDKVAYTDSEYARASLDRKSTTRVLVSCYGKTTNREAQLHARIDGNKIIITEASIRRDLQLADEEGVDCLPNTTIFEQLALMGFNNAQLPQPSDPMENVVDEAVHKELGDSLVRAATTASSLGAEHESGAKKSWGILLLKLEKTKTSQHNAIASFKRRDKKLEKRNRSRTDKLKRLYKVGLTARVESLDDEEILGEDASKQGRIEAIDADKDITLVNDQDDADKDMFDLNVLVPKVKRIVIQEQEEPGKSTTKTATIPKQQSQDKGKATMIEGAVKPKKKDQIRLNEEAAKRLQAKFDEEERLTRERCWNYENFAASSQEGLDKTYDRFQKLISQLEIHGEVISQEDANLKLLRSLPSAWNNIALIIRNKSDLDTLSMDDLYNNMKVYESEIKIQSSSSSNSQNVAFVSLDNSSCTNETVNTAHSISAANLELINTDDLEEMDLKWQVAMLTMRVKRFINKTCKKLDLNGKEIVGFDKTKVKCYNCHKRGHFTREYRAPRNQWNRKRDAPIRNTLVDTSTTNALVVQDGIGGYDWRFQAEEELTNFALMAYASQDSLEKPKTVRSSALIIKDWESDSEDENVFKPKKVKKIVKPSLEKIEFVNARNTTVENENKAEKSRKISQSPRAAVLTKSEQVPVNVAKQSSHRAAASVSVARRVNTAASRLNVNIALPTTYSYFKAHLLVRKPFNQKSAAKTNNFNEKINTTKVNNVTTDGPKAVVSAAEGNKNNVVKSSACWIWKPKGNLIDHICHTPPRRNRESASKARTLSDNFVTKSINSLCCILPSSLPSMLTLGRGESWVIDGVLSMLPLPCAASKLVIVVAALPCLISTPVEAASSAIWQTKKVYGAAYAKLIMKVKKLDKTVKTIQARRKAKIVVFDEEVDLEDFSKQGRKIEEINQDPDISLIQHDANIQGRKSAAKTKDKGKGIMEESESAMTKTKRQQEQERLSLEELFKETMRSIKDFIPMDSEDNKVVPKLAEARSSKRDAKEELDQGSSKKQKIGESSDPRNKDVDELSQEELQQLMIIVLEQGMNVEALQTKYLIIDWEIYTEDIRKYRKIISIGNHTELLVEGDSEMCRELIRKIFMQVVKENQEKDKIGSKLDKNRKRVEAGKSLK